MNRLELNWFAAHPTSEPNGDREQLIARVRREIENGTYDSPARLEAALERMLARLAGE